MGRRIISIWITKNFQHAKNIIFYVLQYFYELSKYFLHRLQVNLLCAENTLACSEKYFVYGVQKRFLGCKIFVLWTKIIFFIKSKTFTLWLAKYFLYGVQNRFCDEKYFSIEVENTLFMGCRIFSLWAQVPPVYTTALFCMCCKMFCISKICFIWVEFFSYEQQIMLYKF